MTTDLPAESNANFRLKIDNVSRQKDADPHLELNLFRSQYPAAPGAIFQPLRFPDRCDLKVCGSVTAGLRGTGEATLDLHPGLHNVPLGSGVCQLEIMSGTKVRTRFEIGEASIGDGPLVKALDLQFEQPLAIYNILQTLTQIQELLEHHQLAFLKPALPQLPAWLKGAGAVAMGSMDSTAIILLERATARPRWDKEPTLRFRFSGRVRWFDAVDTRFEDVFLPPPILPVFYATLERLLSAAPLASADLRAEDEDLREMARSVLSTINTISGAVDLKLPVPEVRASMITIDGTRLNTAARGVEELAAKGEFSAQVAGERVKFQSENLRLEPPTSEGALQLRVNGDAEVDLTGDAPSWLDRLRCSLELEFREESTLPALALDLRAEECLVLGENEFSTLLERLRLQGGLQLGFQDRQLTLRPLGTLALAAELKSITPSLLRSAQSEGSGTYEGALELSLAALPGDIWQGKIDVHAEVQGQGLVNISTLPELDILHGLLKADLLGSLDLALRADLRWQGDTAIDLDLSRSRFALRLDRAELGLSPRRILLPEGTSLQGTLLHGEITPAGIQGMALDLQWDLLGQPCLLLSGEQSVSLFTEDLRQGRLTALLDSSGKLSFAGQRDGLYGVRYFNALVNPAGDLEQLLNLFLSEDALSHMVAALSVFAPRLAEALADVKALYMAARKILDREGIKEPRDFVPRDTIAKIFSLFLVGHEGLRDQLSSIIQGVTEGRGIDLTETRKLLVQHLGEFDVDYELNAILHWLDLILSPSEPLETARVEHELPLACDPTYAEELEGIPSAAEIYRVINQGELDAVWVHRLAELAPGLTRQQLGFVLSRASYHWDPKSITRLRYAHEIKQRVEIISESYGGVENTLQPLVIASFLGEAVGPLPGINHPRTRDHEAWPPPSVLGPEEVAVLFVAGLAAGIQDRRTQLNNRLLLEHLIQAPPDFTREVFIELGRHSPRALSGILFAFLDQDQDYMASEIDLVELLTSRLGIPIPRQRDFMAGGHKARQSYYEALSRVADQIFEEANPYLARKAHLQVQRHPVAPDLILTDRTEALERRAQESVQKADALGQRCTFTQESRGGPRQRARKAYHTAFKACSRLLAQEPRAFQLPWFKQFWLRNEEALKVLSVVRNHQEDVDLVRRWLAVRTGAAAPQGEQRLLEMVARTLYWDERDQESVLSDPLVRLLIDPLPGSYDFSIVSCMGVITDGAEGTELENTFSRLEQRRGIRVLRAHTGIARSLEYNAERIIETIQSCTTPWGIIGYSQGCGNALMAESTLLGGTPEQQRLLAGMVSRNLLFSAANGSPHATSGMIKFARALAQGERYLKYYQAIYSWEAIRVVLRAVKALLDSRPFVHVMGGAQSMSFERARLLHRDGQFLERVPTSLSRAVVTAQRLPETLEYMFYVLRELTSSDPQDTQVMITDTVGHSTRVENESTRVLERCDLPSFPLASHHWAPLCHQEVGFVSTDRDHQLAIYEGPKDYLVWPWVEVNARFGRIRRS